jgi:trehalose 6-phosphate synthase/phosphatase
MRLIIVSNRLPVQLSAGASGGCAKKSIGGLVTGIAAFTREIDNKKTVFSDFLWIGWPGRTVRPEEEAAVKADLLEQYRYCPVFLDSEITEGFYNNYCNRVLWPLFHYFPEYVENNDNGWDHYKQANHKFLEVLKLEVHEDDFIWIHDYHLMLLPGLLRTVFPKLKISFFLHIPFPAFDMFRQLPGSEQHELLKGILGADMVGLHTKEYKKHLLETCFKVLNIRNQKDTVALKKRGTKVGVFPMGIHYQEIFNLAVSESYIEEKKIFKRKFSGKKTILSIDRLDYTKGIPNRLVAFYNLLENYPKWRNKVTLLLIVAPSRREIITYTKIKTEIDRLVGQVNGEFGNSVWTPVVYQYQQFDLAALCVLYGACDIALVTPLRDGMNLIAKEFIAANVSKNGVLILSEFAGAAVELTEAILVNPYRHADLTEAIHAALTIPDTEKYVKNEILRQKVAGNTVLKWSGDIVTATIKAAINNDMTAGTYLTESVREQIVNSYRKSSNCLLFLDYDGTLSPFSENPGLHWPEESTIKLLRKISGNGHGKIVVISGRNKSELSKWFKDLNLDIGAEFGSWLKLDNKWELKGVASGKWKKSIKKLILKYSSLLPHSYLEEKDYALIWDHRMADANTKNELINAFLEEILKTPFYAVNEISILNGRNSFIVRCKGFDKGSAAKHWLAKGNYDFILAIGDDDSDEELFSVLPENAISLKVGAGETCAKYYTASLNEVISLLSILN